jgi:hypothetical protein
MKLRTTASVVSISAAWLLAAVISCSPPRRDFTDDQVARETSRKELMRFLATVADPGFAEAGEADPARLTEAQFRRFAQIGGRVEPAARRFIEPGLSGGPGFDRYAVRLAQDARGLRAAADRKDGPAAVRAALGMKKTCAACHSAYR